MGQWGIAVALLQAAANVHEHRGVELAWLGVGVGVGVGLRVEIGLG